MGTTYYFQTLTGSCSVELNSHFQALIIHDVLNLFSSDTLEKGYAIIPNCIETEKVIPVSHLIEWLSAIHSQLEGMSIWVYTIWKALSSRPNWVTDAAYICIDSDYWMIEAIYNKLRACRIPKEIALERHQQWGAVIAYPKPEDLPPLFEGKEFDISVDQFNAIFAGSQLWLSKNRIQDEFQVELDGMAKLIQCLQETDQEFLIGFMI